MTAVQSHRVPRWPQPTALSSEGQAGPVQLWSFSTPLGEFAIAGRNGRLVRVVFSASDRARIEQNLTRPLPSNFVRNCWNPGLVEMLARYAGGEIVDFREVLVDDSDWSPFQQKVLSQCWQIPYGRYISYAELARQVGSPRAARAVAGALARNPVPIVIPCHRVVPSIGGDVSSSLSRDLGGYSAPGGIATKRRLLEIEAAALRQAATR